MLSSFPFMRFAFATDDGIEFTREHFGSAKCYLIYECDENKNFKFVEKVENCTGEEEKHGDEKKARNVMKFMEERNVKVFVGAAMGPNIVFIRKRFVPVISRIKRIEEAIEKIDVDEIEKEAEKPEGVKRKVIYIT